MHVSTTRKTHRSGSVRAVEWTFASFAGLRRGAFKGTSLLSRAPPGREMARPPYVINVFDVGIPAVRTIPTGGKRGLRHANGIRPAGATTGVHSSVPMY